MPELPETINLDKPHQTVGETEARQKMFVGEPRPI